MHPAYIRSPTLTPYTPHPAPYTLYPTPYTLYPTPYSLQPKPYTQKAATPNPTPYTLHPKGSKEYRAGGDAPGVYEGLRVEVLRFRRANRPVGPVSHVRKCHKRPISLTKETYLGQKRPTSTGRPVRSARCRGMSSVVRLVIGFRVESLGFGV